MGATGFKPFNLDPQNLSGKKVTVMGLGRFGGGLGAARFLAEHGAEVIVTDTAKAETLQESIEDLAGLTNVSFHLGGHREEDFTGVEAVVVNPAVPPDSPFLALARQARVPLTAEMNMFFHLCPARIVGVTGSNGKSTTTAMIANILSAGAAAGQGGFRRTFLGGNIGKSLLGTIDRISPKDVVVLEISSFQLEVLAVEQRSPQVAVWTNLSPNHLDRHRTMTAYRRAKENIHRFQGPDDVLVYNGDDPGLEFLPADKSLLARQVKFSLTDDSADAGLIDRCLAVRYPGSTCLEEVLGLDEMPVPGKHNVANALAAALVAAQFRLEPQTIRTGLTTFKPLPHRLELIGVIGQVSYYDDSIATTPESALVGLNSFDGRPIIILGGKDKGSNFDRLLSACIERSCAVMCLGQVRDSLLERLVKLRRGGHRPHLLGVDSLEEAVKAAQKLAKPGQVVLLSPGCASYDMFRNFHHRGQEFAKIVQGLGNSQVSRPGTSGGGVRGLPA